MSGKSECTKKRRKQNRRCFHFHRYHNKEKGKKIIQKLSYSACSKRRLNACKIIIRHQNRAGHLTRRNILQNEVKLKDDENENAT